MKFDEAFPIGRIGESRIAKYIRSLGCSIMPVYEKETGDYKGPVFYQAEGDPLIAPDMLVFGSKIFWVEAKSKSAFAWHRIGQKWTTGIDKYHFEQYLLVASASKIPLYLFFLQGEGRAKDTPEGKISPTGLFAGEILQLKNKIDHYHGNWGKNGMVYWAHESLKKICELSEVPE